MKRTLAVALIAGALMLSGCGKAQEAASSTPAPASSPAAATPAHRTSGGAGATKPAASSADDVDDLLNEVDKQLDSTDQPPSEQD